MKTLALTTPLTRGPDVREAQKALTTNPYGRFYDGPIDGTYGPETARAAVRAKHWLGYAPARKKPFYGALIHGYLIGGRPLPAGNAKRRDARLAEAAERKLRLDALAIAKTQLGTSEAPAGSNNVLFSRWYMGSTGKLWTAAKPGPPWCAMFVAWCYVQAGSKKAFARSVRYAFCPFIVNDAVAGVHELALTRDPKPGDIVLYQFDADANADHVGLFERWISRERGTFYAIEGNTAHGNDSNGGEVMRRERALSQVYLTRGGQPAFVHAGG